VRVENGTHISGKFYPLASIVASGPGGAAPGRSECNSPTVEAYAVAMVLRSALCGFALFVMTITAGRASLA
jgi:hypothetical protein